MSKAKFFLNENRNNQINPQTEFPQDIYMPANNGRDVVRKTGVGAGVGQFLNSIPNEGVSLRGWLVNYLPEIMQESSDAIWPSNYLFVSKDLYNSQTPVKGDPTNPYPTPWAAAAAAVDGDIIWVLDGAYTATNAAGGGDLEVSGANQFSLVPSTWTSGEYTFIFAEGTSVSDNTTGPSAVGSLFEVAQPITVNVYGQGEFSKLTNGTPGSAGNELINVNHASAVLNIEAKSLTFTGFFCYVQNASKIKLNVNTVTLGDDFGFFFNGITGTNIEFNFDNFIVEKDLTGNSDYTWEPLYFRNWTNVTANINIKNVDLYGTYPFNLMANGKDFSGNNINISIDKLKYTNDDINAANTSFGDLSSNTTDDVGNTVGKGFIICEMLFSSTWKFTNNNINIVVNNLTGERIRIADINFPNASDNNKMNVVVKSGQIADANAFVIEQLRGANTTVSFDGNVSVSAIPIQISDASATGRVKVSGVWGTSADVAIINATGPGMVLSDFVGRGGSTASPITGAGDVAVLSAAFNNTTAITGTTSGATAVQDAGF